MEKIGKIVWRFDIVKEINDGYRSERKDYSVTVCVAGHCLWAEPLYWRRVLADLSLLSGNLGLQVTFEVLNLPL